MKKIISIIGSGILVAATMVPAIAAGNNCGNGTTGPISTNYCTITNTSTVNVTNTNNANITNNVTARSNSGGNSSSYNTLGGSVNTGSASLNATVSNVANVNTTTVSGGPSASGNTGVNDITGPDSDNFVTITNTNRVRVDNDNEADVENTVNATADSGANNANYNTGPASIQTGSSRLNLVVGNHLNDSATGISAGAGGTGGNTGANSTTGPLSTDYVTITNTATGDVVNDNDLDLDNTVNVLSRSGLNSASYNTLGGIVGTGNAGAGVVLDNQGNINTTTVQMAMGGFANDGSNGITGPMSDNRNTLLNTLSVGVDNDNESDVENNDYDVSDSGNNTSNYNTGGGDVSAGLSDLVKQIMNHFNDSLSLIQ